MEAEEHHKRWDMAEQVNSILELRKPLISHCTPRKVQMDHTPSRLRHEKTKSGRVFAQITDEHTLIVGRIDHGFKMAGFLKNWQGHIIGSDRAQAELIAVGLWPSERVDGSMVQIPQQIGYDPVADVHQPGEDFMPRAAEDILV
jgi:hypothetical protein